MNEKDRFVLAASTSEVAAKTEDNKRIVSGYAIVFNQPSQTVFEYIDGTTAKVNIVFQPESLNRWFASTDLDVVLSQNHNINTELPFARFKFGRANNTMTLSIDDKGLKLEAELGETDAADNLISSIKRGDIEGLSCIGYFHSEGYSYQANGDGSYNKIITDILTLQEVSFVNFPLFKQTNGTAEVKASEEVKIEVEKTVEEKKVTNNLTLRARVIKAKTFFNFFYYL
tara:strand:+ start:261 stop:944 length:684 start_codon:yes stop_codon:yes gene_type:complete